MHIIKKRTASEVHEMMRSGNVYEVDEATRYSHCTIYLTEEMALDFLNREDTDQWLKYGTTMKYNSIIYYLGRFADNPDIKKLLDAKWKAYWDYMGKWK